MGGGSCPHVPIRSGGPGMVCTAALHYGTLSKVTVHEVRAVGRSESLEGHVVIGWA